jgi:2-phosphosulfolactate phosphatase
VTPFDQREASCRCEWGARGVEALAPADVTIVVDVLSFSTCVDIALARGVTILPYRLKDTTAAELARDEGAELAGDRRTARYSLSPASFLDAPAGLRCVLPSPNGADVVLRVGPTAGLVLTGCLRNASAIAAAARAAGSTFSVVPAGERWHDGSPRLALEDWLGAGAILRGLPGTRSPEAASAIAAFEDARASLRDALARTGSGRELIERGFEGDVDLAAQLDVSHAVPRFDGRAFGS